MDIDQIIHAYIRERIKEECERLGIPTNFILGVYSCYSKPFEYRSKCEPVYDPHGKIKGVIIKLGDTNTSLRSALSDFRHEMWHAKNYYLGRNERDMLFPEIRADFYAEKRFLEDFWKNLKKVFNLRSWIRRNLI